MTLRWLRVVWCYLREGHGGGIITGKDQYDVRCARCGYPQRGDMQTHLLAKMRRQRPTAGDVGAPARHQSG